MKPLNILKRNHFLKFKLSRLWLMVHKICIGLTLPLLYKQLRPLSTGRKNKNYFLSKTSSYIYCTLPKFPTRIRSNLGSMNIFQLSVLIKLNEVYFKLTWLSKTKIKYCSLKNISLKLTPTFHFKLKVNIFQLNNGRALFSPSEV